MALAISYRVLFFPSTTPFYCGKVLLTNGFERGSVDKTLFILNEDSNILIVQIYVEDIIFGKNKEKSDLYVRQDNDQNSK